MCIHTCTSIYTYIWKKKERKIEETLSGQALLKIKTPCLC